MSALSRLRAAGVEVRLNGDGEPIATGLDRLPSEVAGPLLKLARACREGIVAEIMAGPCPYDADTLAQFHRTHPHLVCCPTTTPHAWWWVERSWCESKCKTPCGRADDAAENKRIIQ